MSSSKSNGVNNTTNMTNGISGKKTSRKATHSGSWYSDDRELIITVVTNDDNHTYYILCLS